MPLIKTFAIIILCFSGFAFETGAVSLHEGLASTVLQKRGSTSPSQSSTYKTRFPNVTWDNSAWQVRTTNLDQGHYQSRMAIANGYLGINVAAVGPFFEADSPVDGDNINGWPLFQERISFATISGFFDSQPATNGTNFLWLNQYGGESVISGVPHWGGLAVDLGNDTYLDASVDSNTISEFSSTLDAKAGVTMWEYTWTPTAGGVSFQIAYTMFAHKLYVNQGIVQLRIRPSADYNVSIVNLLDGRSAVRTDFVEKGEDDGLIYTAVRPNGIGNITAYLYANLEASSEVDLSTLAVVTEKLYIGVNDSSIAQAASAYLKAGKTTVVTKYVGGATSDGFLDPQGLAKAASLKATNAGFDQSLCSHVAEWATVFPNDSADDYTYPENGTLPADEYIIESAITAVLNEYYLLQNTIGQDALTNANDAPIDTNSVSVGGLTSESYAGLVFWDAEIWIQPGLAASHPQSVKQIAKYRVERYAQAKANAQTSYQSSRNDTKFSNDAAVFSWTSGRFGNCTGTGPCFDYEYHINGDIAQGFANYWVTSGDTQFFQTELLPIYDSIATFYSELLVKNKTFYTLKNMTDPDEYANGVDNGGFTMPLIADTLANANTFRGIFGLKPNKTWNEQAANIFIDKDENVGIINEYTGANGSISVKQADVVLNTFPLNYQQNYTAQNSRNDLEYYASKQASAGPGMTWAIYSIVNADVAKSGCASYTYQQYSEQPYARAPWFFFSEQLTDDFTTNGGTHPAYPFLTGHGGANQVTLFGYLGLRLTLSFYLHINPDLPPQIPYLKYRTFYWQGWPISAFSNSSHTVITRLSNPYSYKSSNLTYAKAPIPVKVGNNDDFKIYHIPPKGKITLHNRKISASTTVEGNIAQCLPVSSPDKFAPGQFPISAVDGSRTTKWEPVAANKTSSITVSLGSQTFQPVTGFFFDFGQIPPTNLTVLFHNSSSLSQAVTAVAQQIHISIPYNATTASLIKPYQSNITNISLDTPVYSGTYATLQIEGNLADPAKNASGATIAEWGIIGSHRQKLNIRNEERGALPFDLMRLLRHSLGV